MAGVVRGQNFLIDEVALIIEGAHSVVDLQAAGGDAGTGERAVAVGVILVGGGDKVIGGDLLHHGERRVEDVKHIGGGEVGQQSNEVPAVVNVLHIQIGRAS